MRIGLCVRVCVCERENCRCLAGTPKALLGANSFLVETTARSNLKKLLSRPITYSDINFKQITKLWQFLAKALVLAIPSVRHTLAHISLISLSFSLEFCAQMAPCWQVLPKNA